MTRTLIILSLLAATAAAALVLRDRAPEPLPGYTGVADGTLPSGSSTEQRIAALESALAAERDARLLLEEELLMLHDDIDSLRALAPGAGAAAVPAVRAAAEAAPGAVSMRERRAQLASGDGRIMALTEAGFPLDRAEWILRREEQLRVEAMQARFDAQREGDMQAMFAAGRGLENSLRDEIGDAEYEQYLDAYGRPTAVTVGAVLDSSPGQRAGLQRGDEIVRYDGRRVFSYGDINSLQLTGEPGESVVVDIMRNGSLLQVVMPRGPIGIEAGRYRR